RQPRRRADAPLDAAHNSLDLRAHRGGRKSRGEDRLRPSGARWALRRRLPQRAGPHPEYGYPRRTASQTAASGMSNVVPNPHFWAGKRVCVTGGGGFLGYHLARQLRALGARVVVLTLPPAPEHPLHADRDTGKVFGDIHDPEIVQRALAGCAVVFHTAGV